MGWFDERFVENINRFRKDCENCGTPMWFPKSKLGLYRRCGNDCGESAKSIARNQRMRPCATCGKRFIPRLWQLKMGHGKFCSQACNTESHAAVNSDASREKGRISWRARHAVDPIVKSGPANPGWNGGRKATYKRRLQSGLIREYRHLRRARGAGPIPKGTAQKLGGLQKWKCVVCKKAIQNKYEIDHIMPLALGGDNSAHNLQLLCVTCNRRKNAKHPIDFMQAQGYLL
jgi:hypothetical protein